MESKLNISAVVTRENSQAINQILTIAKQDAAIKTAITALNELAHTNRIEFEDYGNSYGISEDLLAEIRNLQEKLSKAKYGRY